MLEYLGMKGITLLEVVICLLLVAILCTYGIRTLSHSNVKREAKILAVNIATLLSIAQAEEKELTLDILEHHYSSTNPFKQLYHILPANIHFTPPNLNLKFYSSGTMSPKTITLTDNNTNCSVIASLRGRIRHICSQ